MQVKDIKKLYYSISEVSEITELKQYVLRYWESEFPQLSPSKNRAGNRTYRNDDVELIIKIKSLLYEKKFTIKGAKQYLIDNKIRQSDNKLDNKILKISQSDDIVNLKKIKNGIDELLTILKKYKN